VQYEFDSIDEDTNFCRLLQHADDDAADEAVYNNEIAAGGKSEKRKAARRVIKISLLAHV